MLTKLIQKIYLYKFQSQFPANFSIKGQFAIFAQILMKREKWEKDR